MKKSKMVPFRQQLMEMALRSRTNAVALSDEAFHTTDDLAMGNLSDIPVEDRGERGRESYCEETTISLFENAEARLTEINAALERIDDSTFGTCEECAGEIAVDRLRAIPYARNCIQCACKAQEAEPASPGNL